MTTAAPTSFDRFDPGSTEPSRLTSSGTSETVPGGATDAERSASLASPSTAELVEQMVRLHEHTRIATAPGGFERQEADGQAMVLAQNVLPQQIHRATREQLTAWGFRFGEPVDDLFVECALPPGWTKRASTWDIDVFDERGRYRAFLFYKAVFYDRQAYLTVRPRFAVDLYRRTPGMNDQHRVAVITDGGNVLCELGAWSSVDDRHVSDALYEQGQRWLDVHYPRWKDPVAYWTDEVS